MKEGDIVSVIASGEYIGKLVSNRHDCVELADSRIIVNTHEGKMGFSASICVWVVWKSNKCINTKLCIHDRNK